MPAPTTPPKQPRLFTRFSRASAHAAGRPGTFIIAALAVIVWAITGPVFHYSDTWQLVINTLTSIATFLMVFLIQATQNRDSAALHVKLDELIRAVHGARNSLLNLDQLTDEELDRLHEHFVRLAAQSKRPAIKPEPSPAAK